MMNISIEIDDNALRTAVQKGVEELSSETLGDLAKQAVAEYLSDRNTIEKVLFKEESYWSGDHRTNFNAPQDWFLEFLKRSYTEEETKKYRQLMFDTLEENRKEILIELFAKAFSSMLVDMPMRDQLVTIIADHSIRNFS